MSIKHTVTTPDVLLHAYLYFSCNSTVSGVKHLVANSCGKATSMAANFHTIHL